MSNEKGLMGTRIMSVLIAFAFLLCAFNVVPIDTAGTGTSDFAVSEAAPSQQQENSGPADQIIDIFDLIGGYFDKENDLTGYTVVDDTISIEEVVTWDTPRVLDGATLNFGLGSMLIIDSKLCINGPVHFNNGANIVFTDNGSLYFGKMVKIIGTPLPVKEQSIVSNASFYVDFEPDVDEGREASFLVSLDIDDTAEDATLTASVNVSKSLSSENNGIFIVSGTTGKELEMSIDVDYDDFADYFTQNFNASQRLTLANIMEMMMSDDSDIPEIALALSIDNASVETIGSDVNHERIIDSTSTNQLRSLYIEMNTASGASKLGLIVELDEYSRSYVSDRSYTSTVTSYKTTSWTNAKDVGVSIFFGSELSAELEAQVLSYETQTETEDTITGCTALSLDGLDADISMDAESAYDAYSILRNDGPGELLTGSDLSEILSDAYVRIDADGFDYAYMMNYDGRSSYHSKTEIKAEDLQLLLDFKDKNVFDLNVDTFSYLREITRGSYDLSYCTEYWYNGVKYGSWSEAYAEYMNNDYEGSIDYRYVNKYLPRLDKVKEDYDIDDLSLSIEFGIDNYAAVRDYVMALMDGEDSLEPAPVGVKVTASLSKFTADDDSGELKYCEYLLEDWKQSELDESKFYYKNRDAPRMSVSDVTLDLDVSTSGEESVSFDMGEMEISANYYYERRWADSNITVLNIDSDDVSYDIDTRTETNLIKDISLEFESDTPRFIEAVISYTDIGKETVSDDREDKILDSFIPSTYLVDYLYEYVFNGTYTEMNVGIDAYIYSLDTTSKYRNAANEYRSETSGSDTSGTTILIGEFDYTGEGKAVTMDLLLDMSVGNDGRVDYRDSVITVDMVDGAEARIDSFSDYSNKGTSSNSKYNSIFASSLTGLYLGISLDDQVSLNMSADEGTYEYGSAYMNYHISENVTGVSFEATVDMDRVYDILSAYDSYKDAADKKDFLRNTEFSKLLDGVCIDASFDSFIYNRYAPYDLTDGSYTGDTYRQTEDYTRMIDIRDAEFVIDYINTDTVSLSVGSADVFYDNNEAYYQNGICESNEVLSVRDLEISLAVDVSGVDAVAKLLADMLENGMTKDTEFSPLYGVDIEFSISMNSASYTMSYGGYYDANNVWVASEGYDHLTRDYSLNDLLLEIEIDTENGVSFLLSMDHFDMMSNPGSYTISASDRTRSINFSTDRFYISLESDYGRIVPLIMTELFYVVPSGEEVDDDTKEMWANFILEESSKTAFALRIGNLSYSRLVADGTTLDSKYVTISDKKDSGYSFILQAELDLICDDDLELSMDGSKIVLRSSEDAFVEYIYNMTNTITVKHPTANIVLSCGTIDILGEDEISSDDVDVKGSVYVSIIIVETDLTQKISFTDVELTIDCSVEDLSEDGEILEDGSLTMREVRISRDATSVIGPQPGDYDFIFSNVKAVYDDALGFTAESVDATYYGEHTTPVALSDEKYTTVYNSDYRFDNVFSMLGGFTIYRTGSTAISEDTSAFPITVDDASVSSDSDIYAEVQLMSGTEVLLTNPTVTDERPFAGWMVGDRFYLADGSSVYAPIIGDNVLIKYQYGFAATFDPDNGDEETVILYNVGDTVELPAAPVKVGYDFVEWDVSELTDGKMPATNVVIKAIWKLSVYKMSFRAGNGTLSDSVDTYTFGDTVTLPEANAYEKEGYDVKFLGWYLQGDESQTLIGEITANDYGDKILIAKWSESVKSYKVIFDAGNGTGSAEKIFDFGSRIISAADPVRSGYVFEGWDGLMTVMPANDVTVKAIWTKIADEEALTDKSDKLELNVDTESVKMKTKNLEKIIEKAESGNKNVDLGFNDATISLSADALKKLAKDSDGNVQDLKMSVNVSKGIDSEMLKKVSAADKAKIESAKAAIAINIESSGVKNGLGEVTVTIPLDKEFTGTDYTVFFISDDGTVTEMKTKCVVENGITVIKFVTDHFSYYAVAPTGSSAPENSDNGSGSGDSNMIYYILAAVAAIVVIAGIAFFIKRP